MAESQIQPLGQPNSYNNQKLRYSGINFMGQSQENETKENENENENTVYSGKRKTSPIRKQDFFLLIRIEGKGLEDIDNKKNILQEIADESARILKIVQIKAFECH